jgi:hypothetical protein
MQRRLGRSGATERCDVGVDQGQFQINASGATRRRQKKDQCQRSDSTPAEERSMPAERLDAGRKRVGGWSSDPVGQSKNGQTGWTVNFLGRARVGYQEVSFGVSPPRCLAVSRAAWWQSFFPSRLPGSEWRCVGAGPSPNRGRNRGGVQKWRAGESPL